MVHDIQSKTDIPESRLENSSIGIQPQQVDLVSLEECPASTFGISKP